jgi:aryl-phospho-beta-D-glucosidase BglC (GH1 family)
VEEIFALHQLTENFSSQNENTTDVILVNTPDSIQRSKLEGFYYKKYINKIQNLSISNPILIERDKMKISFDSEVMEYLINDLTLIFREKQSVIDHNQVNLYFKQF